jgi:hypothetical protein
LHHITAFPDEIIPQFLIFFNTFRPEPASKSKKRTRNRKSVLLLGRVDKKGAYNIVLKKII